MGLGVTRAIGLWEEARRLGVGSEHDLVIERLHALRQSVISYRERRGTGRRVSDIFSEHRLEEAAKDSGRTQAWWLHEVADQMVHGNLFAHQMRTISLNAGVRGIALAMSEPGALIDVIAFAAESMVVSHRAICALLGVPYQEDLEDLMREIERTHDQQGGNGG